MELDETSEMVNSGVHNLGSTDISKVHERLQEACDSLGIKLWVWGYFWEENSQLLSDHQSPKKWSDPTHFKYQNWGSENEVTSKKSHQLVWLKSDWKLFSRVIINCSFHYNRPQRAFFLLPVVNLHVKVHSKSLDLESQKNCNRGFQGNAQLKVCCVLLLQHRLSNSSLYRGKLGEFNVV